jgi:Uma2 family endonuclease
MSEDGRQPPWTWEAYLAWEAEQPTRYELVDGAVYATGGGSARNDNIGNNRRAELRAKLRGTPCRAQGPDLKVKAGRDGRYPDALIDCGPVVPDSQVAIKPVAVFEVPSRSTAWIDQGLKTYALINQDEMRALVYVRDADGRLGIQNAAVLEGPEAAMEIPELGLVVPFVDL